MKPPQLIFITPSGRFKTNEKICTSFTNYHPETWSWTWSIEKMLLATVSFMNSNENTTGALILSKNQKRKFAKLSLIFNLKNKEFTNLFTPYFDILKID